MIPPFGIAPSEELGFVLQLGTAGGFLGMALAARMKLRNPRADTWWPPVSWTFVGLAFGVAIVLLWG